MNKMKNEIQKMGAKTFFLALVWYFCINELIGILKTILLQYFMCDNKKIHSFSLKIKIMLISLQNSLKLNSLIYTLIIILISNPTRRNCGTMYYFFFFFFLFFFNFNVIANCTRSELLSLLSYFS